MQYTHGEPYSSKNKYSYNKYKLKKVKYKYMYVLRSINTIPRILVHFYLRIRVILTLLYVNQDAHTTTRRRAATCEYVVLVCWHKRITAE